MEAEAKGLLILLSLFISTSGNGLNNDTVLFSKRLMDIFKAMHSSEESFQENFANAGSFYIPINSTSEICRTHSKYAFNSYLNAEVWALKMVDAGSKMPSGILDGNDIEYGSLDECLNVAAPRNLFSGQYCLVELKGVTRVDARKFIPELLLTPISLRDTVYAFSVCVPSTCSFSDIMTHFDTKLDTLYTRTFLIEESCVTNSKSVPLTTRELLALIVVVSVVLTVLLATVYDIQVKTEEPLFLTELSLKRNIPKMFDNKLGPASIGCLNGLRILALCWVLMAHRFMFFFTHPNISLADGFLGTFTTIRWSLISSATLSVDTFLYLSGFLATYGYLQARQLGNKIPILHLYFIRYLRFTPNFAFIVAVMSPLGYMITDGPLWKKSSLMATKFCTKKWWNTFLYIFNFTQPYEMCLGFSWYLAVDFQLFLFSPVLLIPLHRNPKLGLILTAAALAFTSIAGLWNAHIHKLRAGGTVSIDGRTLNIFYEDCVVTYVRAAPFIIGVAVGFFILKIKEGHIVLKPSKAVITALWVISLFMAIFSITCVSYFHQPEYVYNHWLELIYIVFHRHVFILGLSGIVLLCVLGHGGIVNSFLTWSVFVPLTRLSYSAYLLQMFNQHLVTYNRRTPEYHTVLSMWHQFFGDLWFTYICATILYLFVECPCANIVNKLFSGKRGHARASIKPLQVKESTTELPVQEGDLPK